MTEKENAIYEFEKMATWCDKYTTEELQAINYARKILHSVTHKEPKTGHWIRVDRTKVKCSECEITHFIAQYPNAKIAWCPNCGAKMIKQQEYKNKKCEDCTEWEYFDGYGHGCFCMKTMTPIDDDKCEFYTVKRHDVQHSLKPLKVKPQESEE